ncbi:UDP-2,3-diacetamido-2,3-dideoxy-D-glucuronate 2-epimerase [subsurface metagenome]
MKVMTIVGTRPEIIKLSCVIKELDNHVDHVLVHTGQNFDFELNEIFFQQLGLRKPDYFLDVAGKSSIETIASVLVKSNEVIVSENLDAILIYGDTNSCLSSLSAKRNKIPIFHMEAGNRCFDQRVPEEINRKRVDHLSDINMPLSEHARRYLLDEGIKPETIIKTGSPMKEVLFCHMNEIEKSDILTKKNLKNREYFLISIHREENVDFLENFNNLLDSLNAIAFEYEKRIIVSTHPRTRKKLLEMYKEFNTTIEFSKPYGFLDYIKLQKHSFCVLSDSSTITEESSILGFPAITLRQAHDRPEGMDEGTLIMSGLNKQDIIDSINIVTGQFDENPDMFNVINDYDTINVSKKVLRIIISYTNYVNRTVWYK